MKESATDMDWAKSVPCKNITIYGFCRYENKGCAFNHDTPENNGTKTATGTVTGAETVNTSTISGNPMSAFAPSSSIPLTTPISNTGMPTSSSTTATRNLLPNSNGQASNDSTLSSTANSSKKFNPSIQAFKPSTQSKFSKLSANLNEIPSFVPLSSTFASRSVDSLQDPQGAQVSSSGDTNSAINSSASVLKTPEKSGKPPQSTLGTVAGSGSAGRFNFDSPVFQASAPPLVSNPYLAHSSSDLPGSPGLTHQQLQTLHSTSTPQTPGSLRNVNMPISQHHTPLIANAEPVLSAMPTGKPETMFNPYTVPAALTPRPTEMFFTPPPVSFPLQHHLYAPTPPPHLKYLNPNEKNSYSLFLPNDIREYLLKRNEATLQTLQHSNLPEHVYVYHSLVPLDKTLEKNVKHYGVPNSLYKVFSNNDGNAYVLRRLEGLQLTNEKSLAMVNKWKTIQNANVVQICEAFTSLAFGDNSLYFVHEYHPLSKTLRDAHQLKPKSINESVLWSYAVQITNALMSIHEKNLAARLINLDKVILVGKERIKLSSCGISDILNFDKDNTDLFDLGFTNKLEYIDHLQKQDLKQLGNLLLDLISIQYSTPINPNNDLKTMKLIISNLDYSSSFKDALLYLIDDGNKYRKITDFMPKISFQAFKILDSFAKSSDYYESELSNEIENARLVRLLTKINFIIERPEFDGDLSWSETGERYPIKLFRDYVFHQVDQEGKPVVDLVHVLKNLNKLDAGLDEKILLVSKDDTTCIIASFKELKDCIDSSFRALYKRA